MVAKSELLFRACPVCRTLDSQPFLEKHGFSLVRCHACSMIYTNPISPRLATGAFYDDAGREYIAADKLSSDYADVRYERELKLFHSHCPQGSVLDVGCSSGGFLYQLSQRHPGNYQVTGTDVSEAPLAHAATMGIPIIRGNFPESSLTTQFDAVTFWAVMEHLADPGLFLKKAAALLKPGGLCFILVPNLNSLAIKILGGNYRYIFTEHLNYFTPKTLKRFVERELQVSEIRSLHFNPIVIWQDFRGGGREIPRAERASLLKRTNAYKQSRRLAPVKMAYSASEKILGHFLMADNLVIIGRKL